MHRGEIGVEVGRQIFGTISPHREDVRNRLGDQVVLGLEVAVEASMGQAGGLHDFRHADGLEALFAEQAASCVQDAHPVGRHLLLGHSHFERLQISVDTYMMRIIFGN
ncbi:hypothetical protein D3C80_1481470 [compost metagenome]